MYIELKEDETLLKMHVNKKESSRDVSRYRGHNQGKSDLDTHDEKCTTGR